MLSEVLRLAQKAGKSLLELQPKVQAIEQDYKDFVTNADFESERIIKQGLKRISPDILVASEEDKGGIKRFQDKKWVIDPVDGTFSFSQQQVEWGVSIALVENTQTQLGVVVLPRIQEAVAVSSDGESIIPYKKPYLQVNGKYKFIQGAPIWTDWRSRDEDITFDILRKLRERTGLYPAMKLCITFSLLAVASGRIAAYFHAGPGPEDIAAGCLIVEKAGGKVTDFYGNPWTPFSETIIASNGLFHNQLLDLVDQKLI